MGKWVDIYIYIQCSKLMVSLGKMVHTYIYSSRYIVLYIVEKDLFAKKASIGGNHCPLLFDEERVMAIELNCNI